MSHKIPLTFRPGILAVCVALACATVAGVAGARHASTRDSSAAALVEVRYVGFNALEEGRSLVYLELSGPITFEEKKGPRTVSYALLGASVPRRNNRNPLLTSEFPSAVQSAALVIDKKTKTVSLVLKLKSDVQPTPRLLKQNGVDMLEIRIPASPAAP